MGRRVWMGLLMLLAAATAFTGEEQDGRAFSLAIAQPLNPARVTASGRVVALSVARVSARLSAHIVSWAQADGGRPLDVGDAVKAGQELFRLDTAVFLDRLRAADAALKMAQAQLADLKAGERAERIEALNATLAELDARLADNKRDEDRYRRLVEVDKTMPVKRLEEIQVQQQVLAAQRRAAKARLDEARAGPTPTQLAVAEAHVVQAQAAIESVQLDLKDTVIRAPYDGVITRRFKGVGDYLSTPPVTEVLEVVSLDQLEGELSLPERYYGQVAVGKTQVLLRSPVLAADLRLPLGRIIPAIDSAQGTFVFRVAIPPAQRGGLTPGSFLQGELELAGGEQGVVLPLRAVITREGKAVVFVVEQGRMRPRVVELGDRLTEGVIVKRGVLPGEQVVLGPAEDLRDGRELPASLKTE